jgi:dipeptidyl aminopeptidase/acylaminoacyl peptidase
MIAFTLRTAGLALALLFAHAGLDARGQAVERREIGNQIFENIPPTPPAVRESLRRYQNTRSAALADWLPNGAMLISTRFGATQQLHLVSAPGADRRQITFFDEPVTDALVLPQGDRFVFTRDTGGDEYFQGYLASLTGEAQLVTEPGTQNNAFRVSKDGALLVWARTSKGDPNSDIMAMRSDDPASRRVVHEGTGSMSPLDITPDGKTLLLARYNSIADSERFLLDLETGALRKLNPKAKKPVAYVGGSFSPDGKRIVMLSDQGAEVRRLVLHDIGSAKTEVLSDPKSVWNVESFDLSPDGRTVAFTINEEGFSRIEILDMETRKPVAGPQLPKGVVDALKFSADGKRLAIGLSSARSAGDVWSWHLADNRLTRWTQSELGGLDAEALVEPELIRFNSFDGLSVPALVYRPRKASAPTPVIIDIHGGPESQSLPAFNPTHQHFVAELGATVIVPNVRGSDGYGKTYLSLDNGARREDSVRDIGALLDWIATQPGLDRNKVVVYGQSYGGYMVLASMTHYSDRLLGGIERYGISDFRSFLENTEGYRRDLRRVEYGDERDPKMRAVFEKIAPLNNVAKITKPMLIMQGGNDPRVPPSESQQIVRELRARGVPVGYVFFKDEGHGFRKKPNNDARREAETVFLQNLFRSAGAG